MSNECGNSYLVSPMPFTGNHTHPVATTCYAGVVELATEAEVVANPEVMDALVVTPYTLGRYTGLVDQVTTVETSDLLLVRDVSANKDVSYTFGALKDAVTPPQATTEVLGIIELATDAEVIAGTDTERAVTPAGLEAWSVANPSTETERGLIELATDAEVIAGTDTERAVTPAGLEAWSVANPSTETERGLIELATDAEVIAGTDTERAVTPAGLEAWSVANPSTETERGLIELATDAEVIAGTDTERAVTPAGLEAWSVANPSTETERGLIELATDAEVIAGTDTERAVTPAGLEAWSVANPSTETERGLIELATDAEVIAGTDTERAVTPAGLEAWSVANPSTETERGLIELATDAEVIAGTDTERAVTPATLASVLSMISLQGQCRLVLDGTTLKLIPYNGNRMWVDGAARTVPGSGVTLSPSGAGVKSVYYIYAAWVSNTLTLEYSTTGHVIDPATGVQVKDGDASRSLVGMAMTKDQVVEWDQVISWFNTRLTTVATQGFEETISATTPTDITGSSTTILGFAGRTTIILCAPVAMSPTNVRVAGYVSFAVNGTQLSGEFGESMANLGGQVGITDYSSFTPTEDGAFSFTVRGSTNGGSSVYFKGDFFATYEG
ncbi:hypothetical protein [Rhodospirillum sp. A1_3_36]|uniref:hypothetical protein n=1 Tax=Rhodospirillum sp. A1_3_36 TaxID=3391666 RepID=UPI0039A61929